MVSPAPREVKLTRLKALARQFKILGDLAPEGTHVGELPLFAEPSEKGQVDRPVVQVANEIEKMGLDHELILSKGRPNPYINYRPVTLPGLLNGPCIDTGSDQQGSIGPNVGGGKAQRPTTTRPRHDGAADGVRASKISTGPLDVAQAERLTDFRRGHWHTVDDARRHDVDAKPEPGGHLLQEPRVASRAAAERVVEAHHDLATMQALDDDGLHECPGLHRRRLAGARA